MFDVIFLFRLHIIASTVSMQLHMKVVQRLRLNMDELKPCDHARLLLLLVLRRLNPTILRAWKKCRRCLATHQKCMVS